MLLSVDGHDGHTRLGGGKEEHRAFRSYCLVMYEITLEAQVLSFDHKITLFRTATNVSNPVGEINLILFCIICT